MFRHAAAAIVLVAFLTNPVNADSGAPQASGAHHSAPVEMQETEATTPDPFAAEIERRERERSPFQEELDRRQSERTILHAEARNAQHDGDDTRAFLIWRSLAEQGDAEAQARIAERYYWGDSNGKRAVHWYTLAAEQGHAEAQKQLVWLLLGDALPDRAPDFAGTVRWLRELAGRDDLAQEPAWDDAAAQFVRGISASRLAVMYELGIGAEVDRSEAAHWRSVATEAGFGSPREREGRIGQLSDTAALALASGHREAALQALVPLAECGDASAQHSLGELYRSGHGVPQDDVQAHKWLNLAVGRYQARIDDATRRSRASGERGVAAEAGALIIDHVWRPPQTRAIAARDALASRMTAGQIAKAQRLAREWKPAPEDTPLPWTERICMPDASVPR